MSGIQSQLECDSLKVQLSDGEKLLRDVRADRDKLAAALAAQTRRMESEAAHHLQDTLQLANQHRALEETIKHHRGEIMLNKRQIQSLQDDKNDANLKEAAHLWEKETWKKERESLEREKALCEERIRELESTA
ncbi:hypothetical protein H0H93_003626, partial [Arthromyces matolae]